MNLKEKIKQSDSLAFIYRIYKRFLIRYVYGLKNVHPTFNFAGKCKISTDFVADEYSYIGNNCTIYPGVTIGRYTMLAQFVQIIGSDHNYNFAGIPTIFSGRPPLKMTNIGRDVWIGANSIIFTGVKIGDGSIIAAGSIVTKDIPDFVVVGGVPAKVIKSRFKTDEEKYKHLQMLDGDLVQRIRNKPLI